ncbi:flagellin [Clostridium gasigenes]|uniref:flagellin N-terminal helical domain-containing protein n=1 Tax=Clostridium gasigenes TaxID=94869 RepID=UPI0014385E8E|nr:flagellin [Clostridium gasigenes]NKF06937.1 flagellin [Clostridium gasigenes]QSW19801.1 flagellin [Clostridium gasigenes]
MRLHQNMDSLNVYQNYKKNLNVQGGVLNRISTGQKINSAKDNPNKLGQSENFRMQIRGLQSAEKNLQDGVSMIQAIDGTLETVSNSLVRMKELTVQASSGSNNDGDLKIIQLEIDQLKQTIDYTAKNSNFNGVNLISNKFVSNNDNPEYKTSMIGANAKEEIKIPMFNVTTDGLRDKTGNSLSNVDVTSIENSAKNLSVIDEAISNVSRVRSRYGAIQNRMESTANNLASSMQGLEKADSSIRDSDIGVEMADYARTSILHEASTALLAQTNRFPSDILSILERVK